MTRRRTPFENDLETWSEDLDFQEEYDRARARIDAVDDLIQALDAERVRRGLSKADLARAAGAEPSMIRRLLTAPHPNPEVTTVADLARVLGFRLELVPDANHGDSSAHASAHRAARADGRVVVA